MVEETNKKEQESTETSDILLNTFLINKKRHHVLLYQNKIVWEKENTSGEKSIVPMHDIIAVKLKCNKKNPSRSFSNIFTGHDRSSSPLSASSSSLSATGDYQSSPNNSKDILNTTVTTTSATTIAASSTSTISKIKNDNEKEKEYMFLNIYYAKRLEKSRKEYNYWRKNSITLFNNNHNVIELWYETIRRYLDVLKRPKCILMFVNPFGGKKQALQIYEKYAKPLMHLANIDVNCVVSQRHNQIRDIIMTQSLDTYDAICCCGGDGTFAEVFNGLIFRAIKDLNMDPLRPDFIPKPKLPIGIIPAGSTNTVAYCMHGTIDIRTSVIHIILGQTRGLDLSSFCNNNGLVRFYASVMSYGYLGDVALESEKFRWMGPKRYDYSGFKKILLNDGYEGEITYLAQSNSNSNSNNNELVENIKCTIDCNHCMNAEKEFNEDKSENLICNGYIVRTNNGCEVSELPKESQLQEKINQNEWKNVKGKFFMISSANICCASSRSLNGLSPYCHLGDGYLDIVLVRHTSIVNNIRLLLTLVNRQGDIANLPFVEIYRTRKFYFRTQKLNEEDSHLFGSCQPIGNLRDNNRVSQWNCDGEVIHDSDVFINSHCQLIDVFMRGPCIQNDESQSTKCFKLCTS